MLNPTRVCRNRSEALSIGLRPCFALSHDEPAAGARVRHAARRARAGRAGADAPTRGHARGRDDIRRRRRARALRARRAPPRRRARRSWRRSPRDVRGARGEPVRDLRELQWVTKKSACEWANGDDDDDDDAAGDLRAGSKAHAREGSSEAKGDADGTHNGTHNYSVFHLHNGTAHHVHNGTVHHMHNGTVHPERDVDQDAAQEEGRAQRDRARDLDGGLRGAQQLVVPVGAHRRAAQGDAHPRDRARPPPRVPVDGRGAVRRRRRLRGRRQGRRERRREGPQRLPVPQPDGLARARHGLPRGGHAVRAQASRASTRAA